MHAYYRPPILLLAALTIGCTMPVRPNADPMTSSTQGSTLVRMATVTGSAVIATTADAPEPAGEEAVAGAAPATQRSRTVTELTLRFDDGAAASYRIEAGAVFQPGERVKVMTHNGRTRITR